MACFLVSAAEAVVVTVIKRQQKKKEETLEVEGVGTKIPEKENPNHIPMSKKLGWLNKMLWGGAFLLCIEHIWHGEVVPWPPFLTAMYNPADTQVMLQEMGTVGVAMACLITGVWLVMVAVSAHVEKRANEEDADTVAE